MTDAFNIHAFRNVVRAAEADLYRELFRQHKNRIKVKKESVAVRNLARIFEAALALGNEKGFSAMSMRDLGARSGLSMGALYTYFTGKDALLDMIQQSSLNIIARIINDQVKENHPAPKKLSRAILAHLYLSEIMHPWFFFAFMEAKNLNKNARQKAIEIELCIENIFADIITAGQQAGVFRKVKSDLAAAMIKALLQDWYLKKWKYESRHVGVETYAGLITGMVESYLLISTET